MAERVVNPEMLTLLATRIDWNAVITTWPDQGQSVRVAFDNAVRDRGFVAKSVQLRWLLYPKVGLPRNTFTVWQRTSRVVLNSLNVASFALTGTHVDVPLAAKPMAIVEIQFDLPVAGSATVVAYDHKNVVLTSKSTSVSGIVNLRVTGNRIHRVTVAGYGTLKTVQGITVKDFVILPDWKAIEVVGLPVDSTWSTTGYPTGNQGLVGATGTPTDAAIKRLNRGAPPFGWITKLDNGWPAPPWTAPNLTAYVTQLKNLPLPLIQHMLQAIAEPGNHADYKESIAITDPSQQGGPSNGVSTTKLNMPALGNLLLSTSSDTYASLGAGFGTAIADPTATDVTYDYMVTVAHKLWGVSFELADFVINPGTVAGPGIPSGLAATQTAQIPPTQMDSKWTESVSLRWDRAVSSGAYGTRVVAYAIGRYNPASTTGNVLLSPYPQTTGWIPFVPTVRQDDPTHVVYSDGLLPAPSDPAQQTYRYAIAAADLFGRYGSWLSAAYVYGQVPVRAPAIQSVQLLVPDEGAGNVRDVTLQIDLAWDWTWRSPEKIELVSNFVDTPPDPAVFSSFRVSNTSASTATVWLHFGGVDNPIPQVSGTGVDVGSIVVTKLEGAPADPDAPDTRRYRIRIKSYVGQVNNKVQVNFTGLDKIAFTVFARGYEHVRPTVASSWCKPYTGRAFSPVPPIAPIPPELPVWSSLPDVEGTPRAHLTWSPGQGSIAGYVLYQASETALRQFVGMDSPEQTESYVSRLATLRKLKFSNGQHGNGLATLTDLRSVFTRVQDPLITGTSLEVKLPRGNQVIQAFVVTAMSPNNMESAWPSDMKHFFAVATPARRVPKPPQIDARANKATNSVTVTMTAVPGAPISRLQLFRAKRDELAARLDHMGPPLTEFILGQTPPQGWTVVMSNGVLVSATYEDSSAPIGWHNIWYRAVSWSADDLVEGILGARSEASGATSVVLPPPTEPTLTNVDIDQSVLSGSALQAVCIGWDSTAPLNPTALGPHKLKVLVESMGLDANKVPVGTLGQTSKALQQVPSSGDPPTQPPVSTVLGELARLNSTTPTVRYQIWVNRPAATAADTQFKVRITLTDPLGRSTVFSQEINWT